MSKCEVCDHADVEVRPFNLTIHHPSRGLTFIQLMVCSDCHKILRCAREAAAKKERALDLS
jgi:hypothetical protein